MPPSASGSSQSKAKLRAVEGAADRFEGRRKIFCVAGEAARNRRRSVDEGRRDRQMLHLSRFEVKEAMNLKGA